MAKSKLARRYKRRKNIAREATQGSKDLAISVGAGFAGYAATRFISRMAYSQVIKRFPGGADYAALIASAIGAAGTFFGTKYWSKVEDYHEAASVGAGIALLQTGVQTFLPKFSWIVSDVAPEQYVQKKTESKAGGVTLESIPGVFDTTDVPELAAPSPEPTGGIFDLGRMLSENPELEAVPIGSSPPAPGHHDIAPEDDLDLAYGEDYGGMLQ